MEVMPASLAHARTRRCSCVSSWLSEGARSLFEEFAGAGHSTQRREQIHGVEALECTVLLW